MSMKFETGSSVVTYFYSKWNANTYRRTEPFKEVLGTCFAGSTGGAPVVTGDGFLIGLTRLCDAAFEWDGRMLTVTGPEDAVFATYAEDEEARWRAYHQALGFTFPAAVFGTVPEYCSWVEQIWVWSTKKLATIQEALTMDLVDEYLDAIDRYGWPRGRFTVDEGWCPRDGVGGFGDWVPRSDMDMGVLAERIASRGHVPGLWMAPVLIEKGSNAAQQNPTLVGDPVIMEAECEWSPYNYLAPSAASQELIHDLFRKAFNWGYRKFKLDIFYGSKMDMCEILRQCRVAADDLPEAVELEGHIPDPFCAQHMNVIRINDLLINDDYPAWRNVFDAHVQVCSRSAPGMMLNYDHAGGNCEDVDEASFIEHMHRIQAQSAPGYPTVSLLPHHLGDRAVEEVTRFLSGYEGRRGRTFCGDVISNKCI